MKVVKNFVERFQLFDKHEPIFIAVSGGVDSMSLTYLVRSLCKFGYSNNVSFIFIHHQTRDGQNAEMELVKKYGEHLGVKVFVHHISVGTKSNFEKQAREKRKEIYKYYAKQGKVLLGHHIDDSYEWSLMQKSRSGNLKGSIGIPVINGNFRRPFLCVSKKQIIRYAKINHIPFLEDPTNTDNKFERNFFRNLVIPKICEFNPKYLKHYVAQSNELAYQLGCHALERSQFHLVVGEDCVLAYDFTKNTKEFDLSKIVLQALDHLSTQTRGQIQGQIKKCEIALRNGKYGPITLSGNVLAYFDYQSILFVRKNKLHLNSKQLSSPKEYSLETFTQELKSLINAKGNLDLFPFFVVNLSPSLDSRNFDTSFSIETKNFLRQESLDYYSSFKLLREWSKKRNRHKKLILKFIIH